MDRGLVSSSRYSTSPKSPLKPMVLQPNPNGVAGPALCFSDSGFVKKFRPSSSIWEMILSEIPWLVTRKKPNSSEALTMRFETSDLEAERSITGSSILGWTFSISGINGFGEATTISLFFFGVSKKKKKTKNRANIWITYSDKKQTICEREEE